MRIAIAAAILSLLVVPVLGQSVQSPPSSVQVCAPKQGEGARWLAPCQQAADAGDGHAALKVGLIYWNGDGVPKDNSAAAHWCQIADKAGEPCAAKLLGDEAFVRLTGAATPHGITAHQLRGMGEGDCLLQYTKPRVISKLRREHDDYLKKLSGQPV